MANNSNTNRYPKYPKNDIRHRTFYKNVWIQKQGHAPGKFTYYVFTGNSTTYSSSLQGIKAEINTLLNRGFTANDKGHMDCPTITEA